MKTRMGYVLLAAVALCVGFGASVADEAEFHNCAVCKPLMAEPGLMEHIKWETHPIATGMISVTTVDAAYEKAYAGAHAKMMEAVKRLEAGEALEVCPFCAGMSKLAQAGAKMENIDASGAHILAVTSDKPEVVTQIHDHVRMIGEMMKSHHGEDHHGG